MVFRRAIWVVLIGLTFGLTGEAAAQQTSAALDALKKLGLPTLIFCRK